MSTAVWDLHLCDDQGHPLRYLGCATDRGTARQVRERLAGELHVARREVRITRTKAAA